MKTFTLAALFISTSFASSAFADCVGTLTGSVERHFKCVMIAGFGFAPGVGVVSFTPATQPSGVNAVTAAFSLDGEPKPGNFDFNNCADCSATVTLNNGGVYLSEKKNGTGATMLELTSASKTFATPDGSYYTVHGQIEADMPQYKGGNGNVHMKVTF